MRIADCLIDSRVTLNANVINAHHTQYITFTPKIHLNITIFKNLLSTIGDSIGSIVDIDLEGFVRVQFGENFYWFPPELLISWSWIDPYIEENGEDFPNIA